MTRCQPPTATAPPGARSVVLRTAIGVLMVCACASRPEPAAADAGDASVPTPAAATAVDPAARLLDGSGAGEAWDVLARVDDGSLFSARFWVTNEGPGSRTGVAMGYYARPGGEVARFRYGRTRDEWQLAADGRYLEIASAVLDLRAPTGTVEIDTDKGGMKVSLRFAMPEAPPPICARRGDQSGFDLIRLQERARGTAWVDGMAEPIAVAGAIDVTHTWGAESEIDTVLRRIDASGRQGDLAFFATSFVAPSDRDDVWTCMAVTDAGERIYQSSEVAIVVAADSLANTEDRYPVAERIVWRDDRAALTVAPQREMLRVEPLEVVPQPFRLLLGLRSAPRRIWAGASWQLRLAPRRGGEALDIQHQSDDSGTLAVSYTNPW